MDILLPLTLADAASYTGLLGDTELLGRLTAKVT